MTPQCLLVFQVLMICVFSHRQTFLVELRLVEYFHNAVNRDDLRAGVVYVVLEVS